ncbi:MAG TPA: hypothetical protein DD381_06540 [Lentisphaeria bacterium]|nr:MAG: hypothetical protein A2X47_13240 [Lentisphaerae bacterium GWF2_38_69]HBM15983.1 hypothetical protein [Lentisphaeria bacterium]
MEYIVKVNDKEYGPIEDDILIRWVEDGRVLPDSEVRNSKLALWKKADDFSFLKDAFKAQEAKFRKVRHTPDEKTEHNFTKILHVSSVEQQKKNSTDFKNTFLPDKAGIYIRMKAGIVDLIVVLCIFCISIYLTDFLMTALGISDLKNQGLTIVILSLFLILLYLGSSLGIFAQTIGMWYYGLILVREGDNADEVYLLRAFIFAVFICVFWIISPVFNYILGRKKSIHDLITNTQIVLISARRT